jgi:hypothetical protein
MHLMKRVLSIVFWIIICVLGAAEIRYGTPLPCGILREQARENIETFFGPDFGTELAQVPTDIEIDRALLLLMGFPLRMPLANERLHFLLAWQGTCAEWAGNQIFGPLLEHLRQRIKETTSNVMEQQHKVDPQVAVPHKHIPFNEIHIPNSR